MTPVLQRAQLYGICDLGYLSPEEAVPVSRELLAGGASILQLRAKGYEPSELVPLACELRELCESFEVPFIVNDHVELARASSSHGIHLGQDDGVLAEAREELGGDVIVGRSTHSLEQAVAALEEGADYIGFGPLFPTPTKKGRPEIGIGKICEMEERVGSRIPAFCIGGIKPENLDQIVDAGARRIVIVSHLLTATDPAGETRKILEKLIQSNQS